MKKLKNVLFIFLLLLMMLVPANVSAARKNTWVKKGGVSYYYKADGKPAKNGIVKIGKKKYCFDKKGRQLTGWRKVGGYAYYFKQASGSKGYMLVNKKVDGIKLKKNGRANPRTYRAQEKLPLLISARKLADKIVGPGPKSTKKLSRCYYYLRDNYNIYWDPRKDLGSSTWDIDYAKEAMRRNCGDCFGFATTFAYLAHAIGYRDATAISNGHCWVRINGEYYDPFWTKQYGTYAFAIPPEECNKNNMFHTDWARDGVYFKHCNR